MRTAYMAPPAGCTMWILCGLTFLLPWVVTPGTANPFLEGKELLLCAGSLGLLCQTVATRSGVELSRMQNPWLPWLMGYLLLCGFAHFQWLYLWRTPNQTAVIYNAYSWVQTINVLSAFLLLYVLTAHWFRFPLTAIRVAHWSCLSATLVALYAIGQAVHFEQWFAPAQGGAGNLWKGVYAGFGNPSYCALYLSILSPLFLLFRQKRYLFFLGLVGVAIYVTTVRYAWLLSAIGLLSYAASRWWRTFQPQQQRLLLLGLCLLGLVASRFIFLWAQGDERWPLWIATVHRLQSDPLHIRPAWTGYGLGAFAFIMKDTPYIWAHNEWLQVGFELGLIGVGLLALTVAWTTRLAWRRATQSQLDAGWFGVWMAFLSASFIHFPWHLAPLAFSGLCAWSVIERNGGERHNG